jgi:SagB-type dehydrogenase family enzyme
MNMTAWFAPIASALLVALSAQATMTRAQRLPPAATQDRMSVAEAIAHRRSCRRFAQTPLTSAEVSQLCWAAQGITDREGRRTAPSAGALYPLVVFVADALGVYRYDPQHHVLETVVAGDVRPLLQSAAHDQKSVGGAPLVLAIAIDVGRTAAKYGRRAERYCLLEAGHAAQNVLLQATAIGLGGVPIGAFDDAAVGATLGLPGKLQPVYLLPLGHPSAVAE